MRRSPALLPALVAVLGVLLAFGTTGFSDATFTSTSTNAGAVRAAADWTEPSVAVTSPGSTVQGTVALAATAVDPESGVTSVALQYLAPGASSWVTVCTDPSSPYGCSWNTAGLADGLYDLRALAINGAGYAAHSEIVRTTVANRVLVVLADPGEVVRGSVALSATVHNGGLLPWSVTVQHAPTGTTQWKTICSGLSSPFSCTWVTTGFANDAFDLRAIATSGATSTTSAVISDVLVDNLAPTVTMVDPGSPLSGTITFAANAADAGAGISQVTIQHLRSGTSTWQTLCTVSTAPYACRTATTALADGSYGFRAIATDVAGNTATSTTVANRMIDNTVSSVSVDDPGAFLSGTVTVTAPANSTAGVASVRIQRATTGTTAWTDLCTDTTAPYSCAWDTRTVTDGSYDLRAILVDGRSVTTTSAVVGARRVDNSPLRATDVQTANGTGTAGRPDSGDKVTFTFSELVAPGTITNGWTGAAQAVTVRLRDGNLVGLGAKGDTLDVQRSGATVNLGSVQLRENFVKSNKTVTFAATMTATVATIDGVDRTVVTIQLGAVESGSGLRTVSTASMMTWSPSTAVLSPAGAPCASAPVNETGPADREF